MKFTKILSGIISAIIGVTVMCTPITTSAARREITSTRNNANFTKNLETAKNRMTGKSDIYIPISDLAGTTGDVIHDLQISTMLYEAATMDITLNACCMTSCGVCGDNNNKSESVHIECRYPIGSSGYKTRETALKNAINNVASVAPKNGTDLEKIKAVYKWFITNVNVPTTEASDGWDEMYFAYGALVNKSAVCSGMSTALNLVCEKIGIDCKMVCDTYSNHEWNAVKIDGTWYMLDILQGAQNYQQFNKANAYKPFLVSGSKYATMCSYYRNYGAATLTYEVLPATNSTFYDYANWNLSSYRRGDVNHSGTVDITDLSYLRNFTTNKNTPNSVKREADFNGDGSIDVMDVIELQNYISHK